MKPVRVRLPSGIELVGDEVGDGDPLVLIMGLGAQRVFWPEPLCEAWAARGFRVIRFDNRDVGESTRFVDRGGVALTDVVAAWAGRRRRKAPYLLADMADDTFGLLDGLGVSDAHVVGASMGGMIAQTMAIARPDRVRSLTSIMSTTGSRRVGYPTPRGLAALLRRPGVGEAGAVEQLQRFIADTGSPAYPSDPEAIATLARLAYRRGPADAGFTRQLMAVVASGDRTQALRRLSVPTWVVHGDADPLVHVSGGAATAAAIRGARFERIAGMGHDLPQQLWPRFVDGVARLRDLSRRAS